MWAEPEFSDLALAGQSVAGSSAMSKFELRFAGFELFGEGLGYCGEPVAYAKTANRQFSCDEALAAC